VTATRSRLRRAALALGVALLLGGAAAPAQARIITFQFRTTVDATQVGGGPNEPLIATYAFDSQLPDGSGPFAIDDKSGSYGPIRMVLQVGDQSVTSATGGITVINDSSSINTEDSYDVRISADLGDIQGAIFGYQVVFFRFLLVDEDGTMFSGTGLPLSAAFAARAQFIELEVDLYDPVTGDNFGIGLLGGAPFTLVELNAGCILGDLQADLGELQIQRGLAQSLQAKLTAAAQALTEMNRAAEKAADHIGSFIREVEEERGEEIAETDADDLLADA
jgi:hypothetical protein